MAAKPKVKYSDLQKKAAQRNQIIHLAPPRLERSRILITSEAEIKLKGLASYFRMRERWSHCLMLAIIIILGLAVVIVKFLFPNQNNLPQTISQPIKETLENTD
jgi:hypothetical protein